LIEIRKCGVAEILDVGDAQGLIANYAEECLIPDAAPQRWMYLAMEETGVLTCFGAFTGDGLSGSTGRSTEPSPRAQQLVGFVSVIVSVMPHHGKKVATVESLYADPVYRESGAGNLLMAEAERHAREAGCVCLTYTARVGSRLETILALRAGCERSHEMFTKWF
jgi:ribosomal protein S18 acetylase RimI-like enzyme